MRPPVQSATAVPARRAWWRSIDNLGCAWVLLIIGSMSFNEPNTTAAALSGQLNSANLVRYACVMLALACIAPELRHRIAIRFNPIWLFAGYIAVCLMSAVWSVSPVVSLGKAVELAAATATVLFAANRNASGAALRQLFEISFFAGALILLFVACGYYAGLEGFYTNSNGVIRRMMDTVFVSANGIGYLSAITATIALDRILSRRSDWRLMAAILALTLLTALPAQGRTGLFCMIVGTATVLAIHRQYAVLLAGGFAALLLAAVFAQSIETYLIRGDQLENIQTMSGRSVMWQAAWQAFLDRPVSGYGFGVGGRSLFLGPLAGFGAPISSLHSGFMELLVGVGLLGFVPWVMALVWTIRNAIVSGLRRARTQEAAIVLPLLVMTVMSTGAGGWFDTSVAYYLCCAAILGQPLARSLSAPIRATSQARRGS